MERLEEMIASVAPITVKVELVPILLGGLFKEIGTPMVCYWNIGYTLVFVVCLTDYVCTHSRSQQQP